ncbi:hypothetical protein EPYR_01924 [Erwinia pyrifoliae DSM 12163]|nr:hypothetical protein EPYR_01924 [Erwinia pyrifoliae DSM 12163]
MSVCAKAKRRAAKTVKDMQSAAADRFNGLLT